MKKGIAGLSDNHRRSLTSALIVVEKMLIDIKESMTVHTGACCYEVEMDVGDNERVNNLSAIAEAHEQICRIAEKYGAGKQHQSVKRIISAKKTRIWEVLSDSRSKRQKGFGEFPKELAEEFDNDIENLIKITETITF
jgi:hypothetical protein